MFNGRVGRKAYLLGQTLVFGPLIILSVLFAIFNIILTFAGSADRPHSTEISSPEQIRLAPPSEVPPDMGLMAVQSVANLIFFLVFILCTIWLLIGILPSFSLNVKRLHDFGQSGWWTVLMMIPYVNLIFGLVLVFVPGDKKSNTYGAPAKKQTFRNLLFG